MTEDIPQEEALRPPQGEPVRFHTERGDQGTFSPAPLAPEDLRQYGDLNLDGRKIVAQIEAGAFTYAVAKGDDPAKPYVILYGETFPSDESGKLVVSIKSGDALEPGKPFLIGRNQLDERHVVYSDANQTMSREHATITLRPDGSLSYKDTSTNGTFWEYGRKPAADEEDSDDTIPRDKLLALRRAQEEPAVSDPVEVLETQNPSVEVAEVAEEAGELAVEENVEQPPEQGVEPAADESPQEPEPQEPEPEPQYETPSLQSVFETAESLAEALHNPRLDPELRRSLAMVNLEWHNLRQAQISGEVWNDLIGPRMKQVAEEVAPLRTQVSSYEQPVADLAVGMRQLASSLEYGANPEEIHNTILRYGMRETSARLQAETGMVAGIQERLDTIAHQLDADGLAADERVQGVVHSAHNNDVTEQMVTDIRARLGEGKNLDQIREDLNQSIQEAGGPSWRTRQEAINTIITFARFRHNVQLPDAHRQLNNALADFNGQLAAGNYRRLGDGELYSLTGQVEQFAHALYEFNRTLLILERTSQEG